MEEAFDTSRNISVTRLAAALGVSRPTLYKNMKMHEITRSFSKISTVDLNNLVQEYKAVNPSSGSRYVRSHLRSSGHRVQKERVIESLHAVDQLGIQQRKTRPVPRRVYSTPRPNYLWHQDGHHKLAPWGIVVHGIIDGFDRMVCNLRLQSTVLLRRITYVSDYWHVCC